MSHILVMSKAQALVLKEILNEASHDPDLSANVEELVAAKLGMKYEEVNAISTALWRKLREGK